MHGDYDEPDASELGRTPFDWQVAAVGVLAVGLFVFSFLAGGGCAQGAEPTFTVVNRVPPTFVVESRLPKAAKPQPAPPRLIGWNVPQPDGSVLFVPVQPAPAGPMTYPAPVGGPAPDPFAGGSGSTPTTSATTAAPASTRSPAGIPTGLIRIGAPGAATFGGISGCTSYG
jgi:hypothetical protein